MSSSKSLPSVPQQIHQIPNEHTVVSPLAKLQKILKSENFTPNEDTLKLTTEEIDLTKAIQHGSLEEYRFFETNRINIYDPIEEQELLLFQQTVDNLTGLLTPLKSLLDSFNQNLIKLSSDLEKLQDQSIQLSSNLGERVKRENELIPIVSDLIIPTDLIKKIYNDDINEKWCECLNYLVDKSEILEAYMKNPEYTNMASLAQLKALLDNLYLKAIERIKSFIIQQIKNLRIISTPSQVIQNNLLKVKDIYKFLNTHNPELAAKLREGYIYTIRWYYKAYFTRYIQSLQKLKLIQFNAKYLLGNEYINSSSSGQSKSFFASSFSSYTTTAQDRVKVDFSIERRIQILSELDSTCILAKIAETNPARFHVELAFKSFIMALMDNGTVEYLFLLEFFEFQEKELTSVIDDIFKPIFSVGQLFVKGLVDQSSHDLFGLLNIIKLCTFFQIELQKRKIPILENFLNLSIIIIWPVFQKLIDANLENLKNFAIRSTSKDPTGVHFITVQFTNLVYGIIKTIQGIESFELINKELLKNDLRRLRSELEVKLTKISKGLRSNQEAFLLKNYNYILTIIGDLDSEIVTDEVEHLKMLIEAYSRVK
ncbi:hypothetical protein WICPIJ_005977 [Wickerhamomyces pijperi]|uniref:Vacuolar protein sorting-associated protein 52 n=1 Tax=Wickerhamomyces pijperi TaxID=599730 RepID=A0A9P8Q2X1_WICPI|nr:hypothetical protein WICPIJ_005977 [Wickerhamomyces pijperi]